MKWTTTNSAPSALLLLSVVNLPEFLFDLKTGSISKVYTLHYAAQNTPLVKCKTVLASNVKGFGATVN